MPPFLSSLTAALLSHCREPVAPETSDVFALDIASLRRDESLHNLPFDAQHPAASMAVAYSIFLLSHGAQHAPLYDLPAPRPLPVRLDLRADRCVSARHEDPATFSTTPPEVPPTATLPAATLLSASPPSHSHLAHASDLRAKPRHIAIVTTAAMPWMTGTSVNPALRAVYLARDGHTVTLVVPWLATLEEQRSVFSKGGPVFETRQAQADYICEWAREQVEGVHINVLFYEGVYSHDFGSILPVGAITDVFSDPSVVTDVCILEEPEHLTWHHSGKMWTEMFALVIGIIHTNYIEYAKKNGFFGPQKALALLFLNMWVCRGYCHRVIKLSDAVQEFPNSITSNVHGVRDRFIHIGRARTGPFARGAYFMGKVLWAKGYRDVIDNMLEHFREKGKPLAIDFFGTGPDVDDVRRELENEPGLSAVRFDARVADPTGELLQSYKVFVNASRSDVVCTATAEALAMGKLVVCLEHPSNAFFATFANCLTYTTVAEFSAAVEDGLSREPEPLSEEDAYRLSWEAATERLYDAVRLPLSKSRTSKVDLALGSAHLTLSKIYPQPGKGIRMAMSKVRRPGHGGESS